jgi:uroporphyrinogen decarboxylase-like protein
MVDTLKFFTNDYLTFKNKKRLKLILMGNKFIELMTTCPNEKRIMTALNLEAPDKIPSFCQSIMGALTSAYFEKYDDDIEDEDILLTQIGDFTIYKAFGYSSHWSGSPNSSLIADDILMEHIKKKNDDLIKKGFKNYRVSKLGAIRASNNISNWFVEPGIKSEDELKFFLEHLSYKAPTTNEIERWRTGRNQCMEADWVPFASSHVVVEPGNQSISFGLTGKLMRKNHALIEEFYDFILEEAILRFKAAIKAGCKCFCTADDTAYKTGPMFSPKNYRKFIMPRAKILCDLVRDAGGVIFMHTDGLIDSIMDCFIDAGYHAIQPLEPTSGMTIERVKRLWGDKIACIGNVDTTNTLSFGTPQDARDYVHRCFREAKGDNDKISGYVFAASGSLHDKVQLDNALAMMDEYKKVRDNIVPI